MKKNILLTLFAVLTLGISSSFAQDDRNVADYNLNSQGVGFINGNSSDASGFDPVSVFEIGGANTTEGNAEFALSYEGVEYLFTSKGNMDEFSLNPFKYEPTYGGWCARAMASGQKVHINTTLFTIYKNRSFFFVNKRAKRSFDKDIAKNAAKADVNWKRISGESARL